MNLTPLLQAKRNTVNLLVDGGQWITNDRLITGLGGSRAYKNKKKYQPGTRYTGWISVNRAAMYRLENPPEKVFIEGKESDSSKAFLDITEMPVYSKHLQETQFFQILRFPYDFRMISKGASKTTFFFMEDDNREITINAYCSQYIKVFSSKEMLYFGPDIGHKRNMLYALNDDGIIQGAVMPLALTYNTPVQAFAWASVMKWIKGEGLEGFNDKLREAMIRQRGY